MVPLLCQQCLSREWFASARLTEQWLMASHDMTDEYRVQLDIYNGPLDLLLYLIRREEVDIYDIPIAKIADQYVAFVEMLREVDPNSAGEFLVMATVLMEIKSRMLLPRQPAESEEEFEDPRLELVRQLLEYKKFKDAAEHLKTAAEEQAHRYPRQPAKIETDGDDVDIDSLQMWDLVEAFREVLAKTGRLAPHEVQYDDTPIALHAADMVDRLQREDGSLPFAEIFEGRTRGECIGLFLALLELMRQRRVRAEQDEAQGPIIVHLISAEPLEDLDDEAGPFASAQADTMQDTDGQASEPSPAGPTTEQAEASSASTEDDLSDEEDLSDDLGEMPDVPDWTEPPDRDPQPPPTPSP